MKFGKSCISPFRELDIGFLASGVWYFSFDVDEDRDHSHMSRWSKYSSAREIKLMQKTSLPLRAPPVLPKPQHPPLGTTQSAQ
jgi:hypothetical protein